MALALSAKPACPTRLQRRGQDQLAPSILTIAVMEGAAFHHSVSSIILHDYQYFPPRCCSENLLSASCGWRLSQSSKIRNVRSKNEGHLSPSKPNRRRKRQLTEWRKKKTCSFKNEELDGCELVRESLENQHCGAKKSERNGIHYRLTKGDVRR